MRKLLGVLALVCFLIPPAFARGGRGPANEIGAPLNTNERMEAKAEQKEREPGPIKAFPLPRSLMLGEYQNGNNFWVNAGAMVGNRSFAGGTFAVGYQHEYLGLDMRLRFASTTYGALSVSPNYADLQSGGSEEGSFTNPDSELNRFRDPSDKWSVFLWEPGVSVSGRLFPNFLPLLSEKGRASVGFGKFTDQTNGIGFSPLIFSFEGALQYQLGYHSPWMVELGAEWSFGRVIAAGSVTDQDGRLPVSFYSGQLALVYWFSYR